MFDLSGKKALVTGGSRGIGKGIALCLAEQGADVAVNYHSSSKEAEKVSREIKEMGRDSFTVQADVASASQVREMFKKTAENWSSLDVLVNNAGIAKFVDFEKMSEEEWDKTINVNLKGQFLCAQEAVKLMKEKGGRIINISSVVCGQTGIGSAQIAHYVASKGGVAALSEALAVELAPYKINVNAIGPGFIETDMTDDLTKDEQAKKAFLKKIPLQRFGQPKDIGAAAAFLASDEASYITGALLFIDGGWLAG